MKKYKLSGICTRLSSGESISSKDIYSSGEYPVFGGNGIRGFTSKYNFEGRCAVIGRQGAQCGNVRYFEGRAYFTEHAIVATTNDEHDAGYLAYKLSLMNIAKLQSQSAQPGLAVQTISNIEIDMPDINTQKKIFSFINNIQHKIDTNNKVNDNLSNLAKEIYDYWFVQFDFPNEEGIPYKSSGGKMVWDEALKKNIPEGWGTGGLSKLISEQIPGDWGNEISENDYCCEVRCIRGTDFESISKNKTLEAPTRFILKKNLENKKLLNGDILIEVSGGSPIQSTGRVCYINKEVLERFTSDIIVSNFCRGLRPQKEIYTYWLYCTWNLLYEAGLFFKYEGKTTGIKNLLLEAFLSGFNVVLPSDNILCSFHKKVTPMFSKIQKNNIENDKLEELKRFLLPMLMNGQVSIKD